MTGHRAQSGGAQGKVERDQATAASCSRALAAARGELAAHVQAFGVDEGHVMDADERQA
jgi:hypothetical protein